MEAKARAAWQRTANRCISHEDARGDAKLSCSPSSSSSLKSRSGGEPGDAANRSYQPMPDCMLRKLNPDQLPDTKWWLNLQSSYGYQKEFSYEYVNALDAELEVSSGFVNQSGKLKENNQPLDAHDTQTNAYDTQTNEKPTNNSQKSAKNKDMGELWYSDDHLMDLDPLNSLVSNQSKDISSDLDSQWFRADKSVPWWRTADKDELASFVAQKSLEHIENCDLPRPQTKQFSRGTSACPKSLHHDGIVRSSLDTKEGTGLSSLANYLHGTPTLVSTNEKQCTLVDVRRLSPDLDATFSKNDDSTNDKDPPETEYTPDNGPSKAQLLQALHHSQTRAREAEKAAQEAYNEKEHVVKLFFKQASQLFAYKQWLQLLQLENLCIQVKNKNPPISVLFPYTGLPWVPYEGSHVENGPQEAKTKDSPPGNGISRSAFVFALGLSLAGAGLLLGWNRGWISAF